MRQKIEQDFDCKQLLQSQKHENSEQQVMMKKRMYLIKNCCESHLVNWSLKFGTVLKIVNTLILCYKQRFISNYFSRG